MRGTSIQFYYFLTGASHTKNLAVKDLARNNVVLILCIPSHCSHRLQPLDVAFMKPSSLHHGDDMRMWLRSHGRMVNSGQAFLKAANMETAIKGFKNQISLEIPTLGTPTVQTAALLCVQPHKNLQTAVPNEMPYFRIPQDTPSSVDALAHKTTPFVHLLSVNDENSVENDKCVPTNYENLFF
ncbi:hypothetical protein HHI36_008388 [Cryptolaemus montrouzieri]|uniref:DDE-1 domain-containing protein n=1 Tax=Cryptolaemus montrouzieri TaxID=559131 RepID=A0ABD2MSF5_9CUCU